MAKPIFHSQYTAQQIENEITNGVPKIVDGYWYRWDIGTGTWVNTGVTADSETAAADAQAAQAAAEYAQGKAEDAQDAAEDAQNAAEAAATEAASSVAAVYNAYPHDTASGSVAPFTDGADNIPVRSIIAQIVPVQAGSGDPSPDNVRAISGWTGANITRCGRNLFSGSYVGAAITLDNNNYLFNTGLTSARTAIVRVVGGQSYAVKKWETSNRFIVCSCSRYPANGDVLTRLSADNTLTEVTVTIPAGDMYLLVFVSTSAESATPKMQIEAGETATAYQAYVGNTYNVAFPAGAGTVYAGTLTDNGDGTWTLKTRPYYASYNGETLVGPWVSSMDVYAEGVTPTTGAQVVDLGGTETEYTITANSVHTLLGDNNIFADTGDVSVDYRADTTLYIANQIAASVTDAIEGAY